MMRRPGTCDMRRLRRAIAQQPGLPHPGCLQIKSILQRLTSVNTTPTIGLAEAAELLSKHLQVPLVRCVLVPPPQPCAWCCPSRSPARICYQHQM